MTKRLLILSTLLPELATADSFPIDGFGYTVGDQTLAGTNALVDSFEGAWLGAVLGDGSPGIVADSLVYPGTTSHGGAVQFSSGGNARVGRIFGEGGLDHTAEGTFYLSVRIQPDSVSGAYRALELHNGGFNDGPNRVLQIATGESGLVNAGLVTSGENFAVRLFNVNTATMSADLGLADDSVNLFVLRLNLSTTADADTVSLWRNPADLADETMNTPDFTATGFDFAIDRVTFARFGDSGISFDEMKVGEAWVDVTTGDDFDTEGDGLRDAWEKAFDLDSSIDDSGDDNDADGGTDGLTNLQELNLGTNPQKADTDEDGLLDGVESNTGTFVDVNDTGTDPNEPDTDGDTFLDGEEVTNMTDPTDIDDPGNPNAEIVLLDGTRDDAYGDADVVQTIETGFGNNFSELNAAYTQIQDDKLFLFIAGNVEANFNKLEIFIDSSEAVTSNVFTSAGNDGAGNMDGMTFDAEFAPDYHFIIRRGESRVDVDFADLATGEYAYFRDAFDNVMEGNALLGVDHVDTSTFATLPLGLGVAYDNSNTMGVGGTAGAEADQAAAAAVITGLELCLPKDVLGDPTKPIKIMVFQNNGDHGFLSNQVLGGLPLGTENLGGPGGLDFSTFEGDQFFVAQATTFLGEILISSVEVLGEAVTLNGSGLVEGETYYVESSSDLGDQIPFIPVLNSEFTAGGATQEIEITSSEALNFFRVVAGEAP